MLIVPLQQYNVLRIQTNLENKFQSVSFCKFILCRSFLVDTKEGDGKFLRKLGDLYYFNMVQ
jgi:hypothetical protein